MFMNTFTYRFTLLFISIFSLVWGNKSMAQSFVSDSATSPQITFNTEEGRINFQAHLRSLRQIAGAPEAFYTYFWELGDGDFSFNKQPQHAYADTGEYTVRLFATNNYDDGKAPPTRPRKIKVGRKGSLAQNYYHSGFFTEGHNLQLKVNRMPKPNEDMVCIIGYKNSTKNNRPLKGNLILFYNDKKFKKKNFGLSELRDYHKETTTNISSLLARRQNHTEVPIYALNEVSRHGPHAIISKKTKDRNTAANLLLKKQEFFNNEHALHFENLQSGEKRYVFAILHTTPEMIKDTNATVTLSAMMVPDDPQAPILETNLDLQIVASHDPNRMMLSNRYLNYRFMGKHKQLKYKVRFQNTGKGPAHKVDVGVAIPPTLNPSSIDIKDMYPKCVPCATAYSGQSCLDTVITKDSIHFIFNNIYLPGVRQKNVEDKDSTKGFIKYRLRFLEKPAKLPFYSQAAIVFDSNNPVYTNKMHTRYFPGISPAIIAGYQMGFSQSPEEKSPFVIGAALTPYSPYRTYFQVEAYLGIHGKSTFSKMNTGSKVRDTVLIIRDSANQPIDARYKVKEGKVIKRQLLSLDIVPLEVRNNLNDWLGIGGGLWLKGNLYEKQKITPKLLLTPENTNLGLPEKTILLKKKAIEEAPKHFTHINIGAFVDVNIGKVRVGPAVGLRLYHFFNPNKTGLMMYAIWRL